MLFIFPGQTLDANKNISVKLKLKLYFNCDLQICIVQLLKYFPFVEDLYYILLVKRCFQENSVFDELFELNTDGNLL